MLDDDASSPDPRPDSGIEGEQAERKIARYRIRVLLPLPLPEALDYLASEEIDAGSFVRVPLGQRSLVGVVWDGTGDELPAARLKPMLETLPAPKLRPELRRFIERVAAYTMAPPGAVLRMAMSAPEALQPPRPRRLCAASLAGIAALAQTQTKRPLSPARRRVLERLQEGPAMMAAELARLAGCSAGVVRDLLA